MPRSARHPLLALILVALVPALVLGGLVVVGRSQADAGSVSAPPTTDATPDPELTTPVFSVRRAPQTLSTDRREDVLSAALAPLLASVDPTSCAAFSVNDRPLIGQNSELSVIPASNVKIVTTSVALDVLGGDHRFTTEVRGAAPVGGVVNGDLYLVGGGDPVLSEAWYAQPSGSRTRPPFNTTSIEALADAVVAAGVTTVTGSVVPDESRYDAERYPPSWSAQLEGTLDAQPIGALMINDSIGQTGVVATDPAQSAAETFVRLLRDRGVDVQGGAGTTGVAPPGTAIATVQSQPLSALLNEVLATSDNDAAEMLLKEMGVASGAGGTREAGLAVVNQRLAEWGVPMEGVSLVDGSGLSRDDRLTCNALLAVLRHGSSSDAVGTGLALGGQSGTTLDDAFETAGLEGVIRGKTGSLTGVKALSGYFPSNGDEIAYVLILNGDTSTDFKDRWAALGEALLASAAVPQAAVWAPVGSTAVG